MNNKLFIFALICIPIIRGAATSQHVSPPSESSLKKTTLHPILAAAKTGDLDRIKTLIAEGVSDRTTSKFGSMAIHFAAEKGHAHVVRYFLNERGMHPDIGGANNSPATHWAAMNGHIEILELLHKHGANIEEKGNTGLSPLLIANHFGKVDALIYLLNIGADPAAREICGRSLLHRACAAGYVDIVKHLLTHKLISVDCRTNTKRTPLHYAAQFNRPTIIDLLISHACDKNPHDIEGYTPLHLAINQNHLAAATRLIECGSDVNIHDDACSTPMHWACAQESDAFAELLISAGADIHAKNNDGLTPLFIAADHGHFSLVATLIASGADINAETKEGLTPILAACQNGHDDIVELLSQAQEMQAESAPVTGSSIPFSSSRE